MAQKRDERAAYILGFDGGGTKTECLLADAEGKVLARATTGPSNPMRTGYMRTWFALGEAADSVMGRQKVSSTQIASVCAGIGGAGRPGVVRRLRTYFERSFPSAQVYVTTDLEIAFQAAFPEGDGILLLCGTGSAAYGHDGTGAVARAGGRGPWFSDEGSAFDIGRRAVQAVSLADEGRGPETGLTKKIIAPTAWRDWNLLLEAVGKNADDVFPKVFPFVAQLGDRGDAVSQEILSQAAADLTGLAVAVAKDLGWQERSMEVAKCGGVFGRSKFFDAAVASEFAKALPQARLVEIETSPADAAVRMALRELRAKGNAA